jgi:uncharacterized protein YerC
MAKVDYRALKPDERRAMLDRLAEVLTTLETKEDVRCLLERLLRKSEIVMLARRFTIAELLVRGLTYEQIQRKLRVGTSTIRDVDGWLTETAYEYHLIREHQRQRARKNSGFRRSRRGAVDDLPAELQRVVRGDSRFILFRLLLGDF